MIQKIYVLVKTFKLHDVDTDSVTSMPEELKWPSLEDCKLTNRFCMLYKRVHGLVAIPVDVYLTPAESRTRGHDQRFGVLRP